MNKTALKNFATQSRRKLIEQVQTKALLYGIDENNGLNIEERFGQLLINGQAYPLSLKSAFTALQKQLEQKGYKQLLEEVAYTWFNRIIAIRYMEVHEYLPERVNVLSSSVGRVDPDILLEYDTMDLTIKQEEVRELINAGDTEAAYRILFVAQCNALNRILPFMFEPIQDNTELLLPDFLLDAESVIKILVQSEELTESFAEIEVIGWLYQYYIAEEQDRVFAQKSKYKKEEIPFATQLFTPKWIVQYMVQNSLGRYWTEAHREDEDLIDNWPYFIKHEEEDFHEKIEPYVNKELKVEDIKLLDPAMGSGHILVYAFEVLYEIYEKCGYPERDIPRLILENNLYGLDIDDRAYQLAAFAVVMKAASYSKRFLRSVEREGIQLNLASIQETNHISEDVIAYIAKQCDGEEYSQVKAFFDQYHNAKIYGSLVNVKERDNKFLEQRLNFIENNPPKDIFSQNVHEIAKVALPALIHQTKIFKSKYEIIVMNPPYLGNGSMSEDLLKYLKSNYKNSYKNLFGPFMEIDKKYLVEDGLLGMINPQSWMFLSSFERIRKELIHNKFIDTMIHLGPHAFEEIKGERVQTTTFILRNKKIEDLKGIYISVNEFNNHDEKRRQVESALVNSSQAKEKEIYFKHLQDKCLLIPGSPISYWANEEIYRAFSLNSTVKSLGVARRGLQTGESPRFIRKWYEVDLNKLNLPHRNQETKWILFNSGGTFRKWYGNLIEVVNWEHNGREIKNHRSSIVPSEELYKKRCISWNKISTNEFSCRFQPDGVIQGDASPFFYTADDQDLFYVMGLFNSKIMNPLVKLKSSNVNFEVGTISEIPILFDEDKKNYVIEKVKQNIELSKVDWDRKEISWSYKKNDLVASQGGNLSEAYRDVLAKYNEIYNTIERNEELLNDFFKEKYNFKIAKEEVKVVLNEINEVTAAKEFLSYFIGCLFGRYALNKEGVFYAGGDWCLEDYYKFKPLSTAMINLTNTKYFETDIIECLRSFLAAIYPKQSVQVNLLWLAESLGMKTGEAEEERLRRYFIDEFIKDHNKLYKNTPIYWLVDSGKQKGLRTLIYMHRYQPDIMAKIRFEHLQEIQAKYQQEIADLENRLVNPNLSATDKKKLNAEKVSFEKKIDELREFDKRLAAIAAEEIEIDLDYGVKVNYEKFYRGGKGVLAKIK